MSSDSAEDPDPESKKIKKKFLVLRNSELKNLQNPELIKYCKKLHSFFEKKEKKLKKYKNKIRILTKRIANIELEARKFEVLGEHEKLKFLTQSTDSNNIDIVAGEGKSLVDEIREAAESVQNHNGFIYEPTSGLYYDQSTGYYYNAEYGLYYDGNTGCYYKLNSDTNQFEFHSQVPIPDNSKEKADHEVHKNAENTDDDNDNGNKILKKKSKKIKKTKTNADDNDRDREDGEILTDNDTIDEGNDSDCVETFDGFHYKDVARKYPPSLRMIVRETNLEKLKIGTLFIVTYKGGTLGREGNHDVIIPDINVSKFHLKFSYHESKRIYQCVDLGSRNGTILNGKRISTSKQESEPMDLVHGAIIQLSNTKLLCHIHPGQQTCGLCEPGLVMGLKEAEKTLSISHKDQLKLLQKKYGLENDKYTGKKTDEKYNDRAANRRLKIGSSNEHEKTQIASTETAISSENKGFKMLSKLGWNKGESLGKKDGLLEPIAVSGNEGKKGLGCNNIKGVQLKGNSSVKIELRKNEVWRKAQQRYKQICKEDDSSDFSD